MKKSKHYGLTLAVLVAAATATPVYSADSTGSAEAFPLGGFYVGAQIGDSVSAGTLRAEESVALSLPTTNVGAVGNSFTRSVRSGIRKNSIAGSLYLGVGDACGCLYMGAEVFFNGKRSRARVSDSVTTVLDSPQPPAALGPTTLSGTEVFTARLRGSEFGIDFRPGIIICPSSIIYGRVGVAANRLCFTRSISYTAFGTTFGTTSASTSLIQSSHRNIGALRLGGGAETLLCENWGVRLDYVYTRYRRVEINNAVNRGFTSPVVGPVTIALSSTAKARLSNHTMSLGISYYW